MNNKPEVVRTCPLDVQVCVPKEWTDEQVTDFANQAYLCGTEAGWQVTKEKDKHLGGDPERVPCKDRMGFVHVMLHA